MSFDMFPDSAIKYLLENPMTETDPTGPEFCRVCNTKVLTMAFKGTGLCSDTCKKKDGKDTSSVGTYMFVSTDEKKLIDAYRKGEGITVDGVRLTKKKYKGRL